MFFLKEDVKSFIEYVKGYSPNKESKTFKDFSIIFKDWNIEKEDKIGEIVRRYTEEIVLDKAIKTLVIMLHDNKENGKLYGQTPEERYISFCEKFSKKEFYYNIYEKYPILIENIIREIVLIKKYIYEIVENVKLDYKLLKENYNIDGEICDIKLNVGDSHCGKKTVAFLSFNRGNIIYKPRSLSIDIGWNKLIEKINSNGKLKHELSNIVTIDRKNYGYQKKIDYLGVNKAEDVEEAYYKLGNNLCFLSMLNTTDLHMENLIMESNNPYFIDLESLFQYKHREKFKIDTSAAKIDKMFSESIFDTGLLPINIFGAAKEDISGVAGRGGYYLEKGKYEIINNYTDNIRIVRAEHMLKDKQNIAILNGKRVEPRNYRKDLIEGYRDAYELALENKGNIFSREAIEKLFKGLKTRVILRHTEFYGKILQVSTNSKYLKNKDERKELFEILKNILNHRKEFKDVISSEWEDLKNGDIPYFYKYIGEKEVYNSEGKVVVEIEKDSLEEVLKKIDSMDEKDKERQISFINTSLREIESELEISNKRYIVKKGKDEYKPEKILNKAIEIGDRLVESAIYGKDKNNVNWIVRELSENEIWTIRHQENDLYDGLIGNAIFLSKLYEVSKKESYKKLVYKILYTIEKSIEKADKSSNIKNFSAFSGMAGISYGFYKIGIQFKNENLKEKAYRYLLDYSYLIEEDKNIDIIEGVSGSLIVAIELYKNKGDKQLLDVAIQCGNHIVNKFIVNENGVGWISTEEIGKVMTGMAHGNAGISLALLKLYEEVNEKKYLNPALQAIEYERENIKENSAYTWCHGNVGIAMGRLLTYETLQKYFNVDEEIELAVKQIYDKGIKNKHCLCHGTLGNLKLLMMDDEHKKENNHKEYIEKVVMNILEDIYVDDEEIFFMTGLSGIGYRLLEIYTNKF